MGGFRVDVDAVDRVGAKVRSSVEGVDVLTPSGPGGCGSALVASVWDQVCERLVRAVADRLLPAVALWGARVEGAGQWCRERDQALSGLHEGGIAQLPGLQVRFTRPSGSTFDGSGGSGPAWDQDDPGRGDLSGVESTVRWLDDLELLLAHLRDLIGEQTAALESAWTGHVGDELVTAGRRLMAVVTRIADIAAEVAGPLIAYAGQVHDIADRARTATRRLEAATDAADLYRAAQVAAGVVPADAARAATGLAEATSDACAARAELDDLAGERAMADRALASEGEALHQGLGTAAPADEDSFDAAAGLTVVGVSIRQVTARATAGSHRNESEALGDFFTFSGDGVLTPLRALLDGVATGDLDAGALVDALLDLSTVDAQAFNDLLATYRELDPDLVLELSSLLLLHADRDQVRDVVSRFSFVEPQLLEGDTLSLDAPVVFDLDDVRWQGISQGAANDCWLLAGIGATAAADLALLRSNITINPNGTYTVRVYKNGEPVYVTVSGYVPMRTSGPAYAGSIDQGVRNASWLSIYEKAAAQVLGEGSYAGLTAGRPSTGISAVTGQPTDFLSTAPLPWAQSQTFERIQQAVDSGQPVAALTTWRFSNHDIAGWHVYYVTAIEGDIIVVQNPWGRPGQTEAATLRLTEEEFDRTFTWASAGRS
ncbi:C2 family cysteine protease [Cellulomonas sp. NPDC089187]|uniref:C2 family cysteine protease n=1 Tax=Cellulomonas sp. NPDC089187 TaxID=3154970 RepID=UPI00343E09EA